MWAAVSLMVLMCCRRLVAGGGELWFGRTVSDHEVASPEQIDQLAHCRGAVRIWLGH